MTTLYFRSTASTTVSSNASVHQLSLTQGGTSGGTADGTAFVMTASTNYNVGPGTDTVATPGGTITGNGQGWFWDGTTSSLTIPAGTWTCVGEAKRATGGAYTGKYVIEVYVVTATTTVVTKVSLIGTSTTGTVTINTTAAAFSATFSGASTTLSASQFIYAQVFFEDTTVGTGAFSNLVDDSSAANVSFISFPGFGPLPQQIYML